MNPKLKKFLKRTNRGIILAIITSIILVTYIIADESQFKKNVEPITQLLQDFYSDLSDFAITPAEYVDVANKKTTEEGLNYFADKYSELLDKYMTTHSQSGSNNWRWGFKSELLSVVSDFKMQNDGYITDWKYQLTNIRISKSGPNIATITYSCDFTIDANGAQAHSAIPDIKQLYSHDDEHGATRHRISGSDWVAKVKKVDGKWVFYCFENRGYSWSTSPIEGGSVDG